MSRTARRLLLAVTLLLGVAVAVGAGWYVWRCPAAPPAAPPEVMLAEADPELAEAVEAAQQKVRHAPDSVTAWTQLGQLLRAAALREPAAVCFAQAERLDPHEPRWPYLCGESLYQRDPDAALPHLQRAVDLCGQAGSSDLAPRLRLGEVYLAQEHYDEAETQFHRALELEPDNPAVQLDLGLLAYARDDLQTSRTHLLRCRHSPFTQQKACAQLAAIAQRQGDAKEAAELSRLAATLPEDVPWADPFVMECLELAVGRPSRLRRVEQLEAQDQLQEAALQLRQLARERPEYRVYLAMGKDLAKLGEFTASEQALRAAIALEPDRAQAYYHLARLLWARAEERGPAERGKANVQAQFQAAADGARQALRRKEDHALAHMVLGLSLQRLGRRTEALASLRQAVACAPELPDTHLYLGEALAEEGKKDEARPHLERALQLARPNDPRPRAALERLK